MNDNIPRRICVVTGTRAEYGILAPVMRILDADPGVELQIIATNMHLSPTHGMTVREIEKDGFNISRRLEMLLDSDTQASKVKSMGLALIGLADALSELKPDLIVILGDRYEMLAVASASAMMNIPIAHLHGGEISEGAVDDSIRHAITKLARFHFTATPEYRQRVIQLGEEPDRVWCTGSPAADTISKFKPLPLGSLNASLPTPLTDKFIVATYHPVTNEPQGDREATINFLDALDTLPPDYSVLITMPNSDAGGSMIRTLISDRARQRPGRIIAVPSLGAARYYTAMAHCEAVVGNSSSGLIEAPQFGVPTLNIGDRQKGRTRGESVIDCGESLSEITTGLQKVIDPQFRARCRNTVNPYYCPDTVSKIARQLISVPLNGTSKHFYDL